MTQGVTHHTTHAWTIAGMICLMILSLAGPARAQIAAEDGTRFAVSPAMDLMLGYDSDQSALLLPADGVAVMIVTATPFEQVTPDLIATGNWQAPAPTPVYPDDTVVLQTPGGNTYKLAFTLMPTGDLPLIDLRYALVLPTNGMTVTTVLEYYHGLDLETGDTGTDAAIASVIFCDSGGIDPTPTPDPSVIPEPATGILMLLGLLGLLTSWRLARKARRSDPPRKRSNSPWWFLLLLLSIGCLVVGSVDSLVAQQTCTLHIVKQGDGEGRVTGDGIDCGDVCSRTATDGLVRHFSAIPDENSLFVGWLVDGLPYAGLVRMTGDTVLTAIFDRLPNRAPVADDDAYTLEEDTELSIDAPGILANDTDPDGDALSATLISGPASGTVTLNADGSFTYRPDPDFFGDDAFTYRASDGDLESADATVAITVNPVNESPIAVNDAYTTDEDVPLDIAAPGVLDNDSDPDGDALSAVLVNEPSHGTLTLSPDGSFTYTPEPDFSGIDQFIYRVSDGELESAIAAVTITVNAVDDAPIADDLAVETVMNHPVAILLQGFDGDNDPLTYRIIEAPTHGTLSGTDNRFTYTPETDFSGQDSFTYLVNDGISDSNIATVTITVLDIDLAISDVDVSQAVFDPQAMTLTGTVEVTFENAGAEAISGPYTVQVYVEDTIQQTQHVLGSLSIPDAPNPGESLTLSIPVDGPMVFKDNLIYAVVDSENVIAERNEDNNIAHSMADCQEVIPPSSSRIINLDASQCEAITIPLGAGQYLIAPIGQADGGQWNAWNSEGYTSNCNAEGVCAGAGWGHEYSISSSSLGTISVTSSKKYANDILALTQSRGIEILLSEQEDVSFAINDASCSDNQGGVSLKIFSDSLDFAHVDQGASVPEYSSALGDWQVTSSVDPRDIIGGNFSTYHTGEVGNFIFTQGDLDQYVIVDLGAIRTLLTVGAKFGEQIWFEDREVWDYFAVSTALEPNAFTLLEQLGSKDVTRDVHEHAIFFTLPQPVTARYLKYEFGRTTNDWGGGSRVMEVYAYGAEPLSCEDYSASYIRVDAADFPNSATITARIGNAGIVDLAVPLDVAFYHGDPQAGGTLIGTTTLAPDLPSGAYQDVSLTWNAPSYGLHELYVVVDDDGTGQGKIRESDETNNTAFTTFEKPDYDLEAGQVDVSQTVFDPTTMQLSGTAEVSVTNLGTYPIDSAYTVQVYVEDTTNQTQHILGSLPVTDALNPGDSLTVSIPVDGPMVFKDNLIYAFVDNENLITESNEDNNIAHSMTDCQMEPAEPGSFNPVVEWSWTNPSVLNSYRNVMMTPAVIDLTGDDIPEIIFGSTNDTGGRNWTTGVLRVLNGYTGQELFTVSNSSYFINTTTSIAVADIDNDELPEIVAGDSSGSRLIAFEHDGSFKWRSPNIQVMNAGAISIADIDQDGLSDIVLGRTVLNHDGSLKWAGTGNSGFNVVWGPISVVADIDLDGKPNVIAGSTVYREDGSILWDASLGDGFSAVGNFDEDAYPEIVMVKERSVSLLEHTGTLKWIAHPFSGRGGAPTIADFDGDGAVEISVAGEGRYAVVNTDGTVLWRASIRDRGSHVTGSSVFDFEGDGSAEVVYSDETNLWIFAGENGAVLYQLPMSSCTWTESPIIADVDNDNNAEIVVVANNNCGIGPQQGVYVIGDANDSWVNTRKIWNQHSYHITNVNDDGTIPQFEANSWQEHNTYRCNLSVDALACEDYSASYIRVDAADFPTSATITARVGNAGIVDLAMPLDVAFYHGDPQAGGTLLGTTTLAPDLPSGSYEDVSLTWNAPPYGLQEVYVVVDDDGTGQGKIRESDESNNTASATLLIGEAPVADAGADQQVFPGTTVTLDGSGSSDPAGYTPLTYQWQLASMPDGSTAALDDSTSETPSFVADLAGTYMLQLVVENTMGIQSAIDQVTVTAGTPNDPPTIAITSPADDAMYMSGGPVRIQTEATDTDGTITKVEFYAGATLLGEDGEAPYEYVWTDMPDGSYRVTAIAYDDDGASTESAPVNIGIGIPANRPPEITSDPPVTVEHETTFTYDVDATDPDNDTLIFSLTESPAGMTIEADTGLITWTPTVDQVGSHPVRVIVEDGHGAGASQTFTLHVTQPQSGNQFPPSITSTPPQIVVLGDTYTYDVEATDGDGDVLTYTLSIAPSGMSIDPVTGLIVWTPEEAQLGAQQVTALVSDGRGGLAGQYFTILVQEPNQLPTISIGYPVENQQMRIGETLTIQAQAADADGTVARVEFFADSVLLGEDAAAPYQITWTPSEPGQKSLTAIAYDNDDDSTTSEAVSIEMLEPLPDTAAPEIEIAVTPEYAAVGQEVTITLTIIDDSDITDITLEIDGTSVPVVDNQATYTPTTPGFFTITATATDAAGNSGEADATFGVSDGTDTTPPEVDLHDDVELQCVELAADLYDLVGSVTDDNPVHYKLMIRDKGCGAWQTVAEGTSETPISGTLSTFDPTIHRNGLHEVRLWAEDTAGNSAEVSGCLLVDGRFKAGQAAIGGIDFNIPELGYPLLVGRVYDSRNSCEGGFGNGWAMPHEPSNIQTEFTYDPSSGWGEDAKGTFFTTYYLISHDRKVLVLRLGDGAVFKFRMDVNPKSSFMRPIMNNYTPLYVDYIPIDNTKGRLEAMNVDAEQFLFSGNGGTLADAEGTPYNPTRFRLTLEDGSVYLFDKYEGLLSMTDPYGHGIEYSDTAITHSSGASLSIERDTSSRIERIKDQLGRTVEYHYDENGMLEKVVQLGEGPYPMRVLEAYGYQKGIFERPVLKDILAPDGTRLGAFEYDSSGRKTGLIDHNGNRVLFGYDAPQHEYTVTDRRGNPTTYVYDADGNVTGITDAEGNTTTYTYDANGNVLSTTNALGYTTSMTYDADDNMLSTINALGQTTSYTYDADGNKLTETDPLGNTTTYTYNAYNKVTSVKDALENTTKFVYDEDGLKISEENALGQVTTFTYDDQGNLAGKTDPLGQTKQYAYNGYGRVTHIQDSDGTLANLEYNSGGNPVQVTEPLGTVVKFEYDALGNLTKTIDQLGHVTQHLYDPNGNLVTKIDQEGHATTYTYNENDQPLAETVTRTTPSGIETMTSSSTYDALGRVVQRTDAAGNVSNIEFNPLNMPTATEDKLGNRRDMAYDPIGNVSHVRFADGTTRQFVYDAAGRHVSTTDGEGQTTSTTYDEVGRPVKTTYPGGAFTETVYNEIGQVVERIDERGNATIYTYDDAGQNTSITDAAGNTVFFEYSTRGQLLVLTDSNDHETRFTYDANGRKTATIFPDGTSIAYGYDDKGRLISETDQAGNTMQYEYDKVGRLTNVIDALGYETTYAYDEVGNLVAQTDAEGNTTTFEYDHRGNMTRRTLPLGMSETMMYDEDGNLISKTDFNGQTITFAYNTLNQPVRKTYPDGTFVEYAYNNEGLPVEIITEQGATSFTYDARSRLRHKTTPDGRSIAYTYDEAGNRTSVTTLSGTVTYTFNDLNQTDTLNDPDTGTSTYTYDDVGNLKTVTYPNGTIAEYTYDDLNRLTYLENRTSDGTILIAYTYTLDAAGNRTRVVEQSGRMVEYDYDSMSKLERETITETDGMVRVISYTYDRVGNRLTKTDCTDAPQCVSTTYVYDDNNRLTQEGLITYTYDDNGNLFEKSSPDEQVVYAYDFENHLIRAETTALGATIVVEYAYDALGNRIRKTIDRLVTTTYLVDENRDYAQVLEERDENGNLLVRYVYGHDLISQTRGGATTYYHYDGLGSTRALTNSAGAVIDTYTYDAFGNLLDKTGATVNTHLYTGEFFDSNTGFYYLRARYMNPAVGRFVTMDTFAGRNRDPYSLHKYLYAHANPITYVDPSGHLDGDINAFLHGTEENLKTDVQQGRIAQKVMVPAWKRIVAGILVIGYASAVATQPYSALPEPVEPELLPLLKPDIPQLLAELKREGDSDRRKRFITVYYASTGKFDDKGHNRAFERNRYGLQHYHGVAVTTDISVAIDMIYDYEHRCFEKGAFVIVSKIKKTVWDGLIANHNIEREKYHYKSTKWKPSGRVKYEILGLGVQYRLTDDIALRIFNDGIIFATQLSR